MRFYSNGKLLLTGEYLVLDGAMSLAIPTKYGQSLNVTPITERQLIWQSLNSDRSIWYKGVFNILNNGIITTSNTDDTSKRIIQIINAIKTLNPNFLNTNQGFKIITELSFPKDWGLGTSSTLINNLAQWAHVNPYDLLKLTFGGSGYDIACAQTNGPITYQIKSNTNYIDKVAFNPDFKDHLYFVYLNKKQNSREGIATYKSNKNTIDNEIDEVNAITKAMIACNSFSEFQDLIERHEAIISNIIKQTPVKKRLFSDFQGSIKSLGAWGGDFVLVTSENNPTPYFKNKGYHTVLQYSQMTL
ncbi:GYDIA family GHMP kinase [Gaetbulibacter saemankumensis]|uniref:GYDIA family GHMP kinase n=1 Tax=Gaetbulibacter saemankumensis TaxID=311208 RepID=UPI00041600AE|nr:GYDIA family GHMP kinase [Gaetbulibacter saemankumensis]